jgi:hypothetical protein
MWISTAGTTATNLVTNGTWDANTTGWTTDGNGTFASVAGGQSSNCLQCTNGSNTWNYISQSLTITNGASYTFTVYHKNGTGPGEIMLGNVSNPQHSEYWDSGVISDGSWAQKTQTFTATSTTLSVTLYMGDGTAGHTTLYDECTLVQN